MKPNVKKSRAKMRRDTVTVESFFTQHSEELQLHLVAAARGLKNVIPEPTVNRPGLALAGYTEYFAHKRIQAIGSAESSYLANLSEQERRARYAELFKFPIPGIVYSRNIKPDPMLIAAAEAAGVPVFQSPLVTMKFISLATIALETMFAPYGSELGSMVDILGVGVLLRGESGIGKSECVLALVERGYSLVSDDITRVSLMDGRHVMGTSPETTRDFMEVRGIGIINVPATFGVKSVRRNKSLDLVVSLEAWRDVEDVDRLGMDDSYEEILGVLIPRVTIPVRPGRDIARLVEVAAFQAKLKAAGHNPARELDDRIQAQMARESRF